MSVDDGRKEHEKNMIEPRPTERRAEPLQIRLLTRAECEGGRHELCPAMVVDYPRGEHPTLWACVWCCHRALAPGA
jgi:hypothetical protein